MSAARSPQFDEVIRLYNPGPGGGLELFSRVHPGEEFARGDVGAGERARPSDGNQESRTDDGKTIRAGGFRACRSVITLRLIVCGWSVFVVLRKICKICARILFVFF